MAVSLPGFLPEAARVCEVAAARLVLLVLRDAASLPDQPVRGELVAVHVERDQHETRRLQLRWAESGIAAPLIVLDRRQDLVDAVVEYADELAAGDTAACVEVVLPRSRNWVLRLGEEWDALGFRLALLGRRHVRLARGQHP